MPSSHRHLSGCKAQWKKMDFVTQGLSATFKEKVLHQQSPSTIAQVQISLGFKGVGMDLFICSLFKLPVVQGTPNTKAHPR